MERFLKNMDSRIIIFLVSLSQSVMFCVLFIYINITLFLFYGSALSSALVYLYLFFAYPAAPFQPLLKSAPFIRFLSFVVITIGILPYLIYYAGIYKLVDLDDFYITRYMSNKMYVLYFGNLRQGELLSLAADVYAISYVLIIILCCIAIPIFAHTVSYIKRKTVYGRVISDTLKIWPFTYILVLAQFASLLRIYYSYKVKYNTGLFIDIVTFQSIVVGVGGYMFMIVSAVGLYLRFGPNGE